MTTQPTPPTDLTRYKLVLALVEKMEQQAFNEDVKNAIGFTVHTHDPVTGECFVSGFFPSPNKAAEYAVTLDKDVNRGVDDTGELPWSVQILPVSNPSP